MKLHVLDKDQGFVELLHIDECIEVVNAARVSLDRESKKFNQKDRKLMKFLLLNSHTSPLEHLTVKFKFYMPLFVFRQTGKHRTVDVLDDFIDEAKAFKYWIRNEVSRRYTSENIEIYTPSVWRKQDDKNKQGSEGGFDQCGNLFLTGQYDRFRKNCLDYFYNFIDSGVCREQARGVLPVNLMIKFIARTDLNNLMKFLILRLDEDAQWEIRQYAEAIYRLTFPYVGFVWQTVFIDLLGYKLDHLLIEKE